MQPELVQSDIEWLRCVALSRKLTPLLPETVQRKLEAAALLEERDGRSAVTSRGAELLRQR